MIGLLFQVIVLCIVGGLVYWLVQMLPIPEPFGTILRVCVILICILVVLSIAFGGGSLIPTFSLRR